MIKKKNFSNNIILYVLNDKYFKEVFKNDFTIVFTNYGAILDIKHKIYGIQHLLEHAIFENYRNLNVYANASTSVNDMSLELNFSKNYKKTDDPCLKFVRKCLFENNNFTKINVSRDLTDERIKHYINELDAEHIFRSTLNASWNLEMFVYSNKDVVYFGGNKNTFENKVQNIKAYLKKPEPIDPSDIVLFLKRSKLEYLEEIEKIFSQIKPINKKKLELKINPEKYYNKIFKTTNVETNQISFIINKSDVKHNFKILFVLMILYPFFYFEINSLDEIFVSFVFKNIFSLFNFFNILKYKILNRLSLEDFDYNIDISFNIFLLNKYLPDEIFNDLYSGNRRPTYSEYYFTHEKDINNLFKFFSDLIKKKKFFFNLTKEYIINNETNVSLEKYLMVDVNLEDNFFLNKTLEKFNVRRYIQKNFYHQNIFYSKTCLKCFNNVLFINEKDNITDFYNYKTFLFNVKNGVMVKLNKLNNSNTRLSYNLYINALIFFFSNPIFNSFKDCLEAILTNKALDTLRPYYNNINLKFSKRNFIIKTGYEFVFLAVKVNQSYMNKLNVLYINIEEYLKSKGISYYLQTIVYQYDKFSLVFFFTQTDKERSLQVYNVVKNLLNKNYIKNDIVYVISEKSFETDFTSLNKFVKFTI